MAINRYGIFPLLLLIGSACCQPGRLVFRPSPSKVRLASGFPGCPPLALNVTECPVSNKRCFATEDCGSGRVCCPVAHPAVLPGCSECAQKVDCGCGYRRIPVCGSDGVTYQNECWMECGGAQWACAGKCPCEDQKPGICPPPSPDRIGCLKGVKCQKDSDCDLSEKCCSAFHTRPTRGCKHECQPPYKNRDEVCIRTKPWWLGTVQGTVSLMRFAVAKAVSKEKRQIVYFVNAIIEALEMGAMAFDFFVLDSGYLNTMLGDNSMLESIEVVWMLIQLVKVSRDRDERDKSRILDVITSILYLMRLALIVVAIVTSLFGALWFGVLALGMAIVSVLLLGLFFFFVRYVMNLASEYKNDQLWTLFCIVLPGVALVVPLAGAFMVLEMSGIAGWNHVRRQPPEFHITANGTLPLKTCNSIKVLFDSEKCNLSFVETADYRKTMDYVYDCGGLRNWIRDIRDAIVMGIGIL